MRSLAQAAVLALALLAAVAPATASLPSIGVYFDPACATCSATASVGIPIDLYVNAQLGGWLPAGMAAAEFRIDGMPADWWVLSITPNPTATVVLGNPWTGCNIAFQDCQGPAGGCINLYVIRVLPVSVRTDVHLQVKFHSNPSCPGFCCINLTACDAPYYTNGCAGGGQAWINGPACTVGVSAVGWGSVKRLYD